MSELLLHFTLPFTAFSYFRKLKEAFLLSLIALLPDLDVFIGIHRSWTHSALLILAFCGAILILIKTLIPKLLDFSLHATLALISHLLLDLFTTYTPLLWPLIPQSLLISLNGGVRIGESLQVYVTPNIHAKPTSFKHFQSLDAPLFTSEGFIIAAILIGSVILSKHSSMLKHILQSRS